MQFRRDAACRVRDNKSRKASIAIAAVDLLLPPLARVSTVVLHDAVGGKPDGLYPAHTFPGNDRGPQTPTTSSLGHPIVPARRDGR